MATMALAESAASPACYLRYENGMSAWISLNVLAAGAQQTSCRDTARVCKQDIRDLHSAFVADAVASCKEAANAVEGAHQTLIASGMAQARLLERMVAAQHAAAQQALAAAQADVAATIRCCASCRTAAPCCPPEQNSGDGVQLPCRFRARVRCPPRLNTSSAREQH